MSCVHIPTRLPFAASSMGQLRSPTWAPKHRGQIRLRTRITRPDAEEVQGWMSAQRVKKTRLSWAARGIWLASWGLVSLSRCWAPLAKMTAKSPADAYS